MFNRTLKIKGKPAGLFCFILVLFLIIGLNKTFSEPIIFNPDEIAAAETHMWRAYYAIDLPRLHNELTALLRSQFRISSEEAESIANSLGLAAMRFEISRGNYEQGVLPNLEEAYRKLKAVFNRPFDPRQAARAELAWWVARRTPGQNGAKQVGKRIAELYAILYGADKPQFLEAGILRAKAAKLRDLGGVNSDWGEVERLLRQSYRLLAGAVQ